MTNACVLDRIRRALRISSLRIVLPCALVTAALLPTLLAGCGDEGGSAQTASQRRRHKHTPTPSPTPAPFISFGVAVVGDDGSGFSHGLQVIQVEDAHGTPEPTPQETFVPLTLSDIDGLSFTPDGTHGAIIDGSNLVHFFTADLATSTISVLPATIDVTQFGGDGDSIASLPGGDEVVVSAGGATDHALISGILGGMPALADSIPTSNQGVEYDGIVISADGKVMLSRSGVGGVLDVYSITAVAAHPGSLGGTVAFSFSLTKTLTGVPTLCCDGREGMAISPTDSSRAVLVGSDGSVHLLTGLPTSPVLGRSLPTTNSVTSPSAAAAIAAYAVAITPDGKYAIVGTSEGLLVFSGVDTGTLAQVGSAYSPTFAVPGGTCQLTNPQTLGVMSDGKYVVTIQNCSLTQSSTNIGAGVLLTIPFSAGTLSAPVGQLNYVVTPGNDQLVVH